MMDQHARGGIAHDELDVLLRLSALAMRFAILAVMLMPVRTGERAFERALDGFAAPRAHRVITAHSRIMIAAAVDAADSLHGRSVFRCIAHGCHCTIGVPFMPMGAIALQLVWVLLVYLREANEK